MTVQQLIDKLKTYPGHATVIYQAYSDYQELESKEIKFFRVEDRKVAMVRDGYMQWKEFYDSSEYQHNLTDYGREQHANPVFIDAVVLPGN